MLWLWLSNINLDTSIVQVKLQVQSIDWFKSITWWRVTCSWCLCFWRRRRRRWRWSNKLSFLNLVLHFRGLDDCFKLSILFLLTSQIFSRLYFLYDFSSLFRRYFVQIFSLYITIQTTEKLAVDCLLCALRTEFHKLYNVFMKNCPLWSLFFYF